MERPFRSIGPAPRRSYRASLPAPREHGWPTRVRFAPDLSFGGTLAAHSPPSAVLLVPTASEDFVSCAGSEIQENPPIVEESRERPHRARPGGVAAAEGGVIGAWERSHAANTASTAAGTMTHQNPQDASPAPPASAPTR